MKQSKPAEQQPESEAGKILFPLELQLVVLDFIAWLESTKTVVKKSHHTQIDDKIKKLQEYQFASPSTPEGKPGEVVEAAKDYDLEKLYEWLMDDNRKQAQTYFTAGMARNIAREIEFRIAGTQWSSGGQDQDALWQEFYEEMRPFLKLAGAAQFKKTSSKFIISHKDTLEILNQHCETLLAGNKNSEPWSESFCNGVRAVQSRIFTITRKEKGEQE